MKSKTGKKIFVILVSLMIFAALMPITALATESNEPTRADRLTIEPSTAEMDMLEAEGWKWNPSNNGGTLTLKDFYAKITETSDIYNYAIHFKGFSSGADIIVKFEGTNVLETQIDNKSGCLINASSGNLTLEGASNATLKCVAPGKGGSSEVFAFFANNLYIKSGNIESNVGLCLVDREINISGGSVTVNAEKVPSSDGIYTIWGPVNISGGKVYIHGARNGIFVAGNSAKPGDSLAVNITGGDVTAIADNPGQGEWGYGISSPNILIETEGKMNVYGSHIAIFSPVSTNGETRTISILKAGRGSAFGISSDSPYEIVYVNGAGGGTSTAIVTINPADYTDVDAAIDAANKLNPDLYKNYEIVPQAIDKVEKDLTLIYQAKVDDMAEAINDAISKLEYKDTESSASTPAESSPTSGGDSSSGNTANGDSAAETGDYSNAMIYLTLLALSATGILGAVFLQKRKKQSEK